jgi:hypothetical protein
MALVPGFERLLGQQVRLGHDPDHVVVGIDNRERARVPLTEPGSDLLE